MALSARAILAPSALLLALLMACLPQPPAAGDPPAAPQPAPSRADAVWPLALLERRAQVLLAAPLPGPEAGEVGYLTPGRPEEEPADGPDTPPHSEAPPLLSLRMEGSAARIVRSGGSHVLLGALTSEERADVEALLASASVALRVRVEVDSPWGRGALSTTVRPGQRARLGGTWQTRELRTYAPELACDNSGGLRPSALGKPVLEWGGGGWGAEVRPFLVPGSQALAVEVLVTAGARVGTAERLLAAATILGELELPTADLALLTGSGSLAPGQALLLQGALEGAAITARVTAEVLGAGVDPLAGPRLSRLPTDLLLVPPWTVAPMLEDVYGLNGDPLLALTLRHQVEEAAFSPAELVEALRGGLLEGGHDVQADVARGGTDVLGTREARAEVLARLEHLARPLGRSARLRVDLRAAGESVGALELSALHGRRSAVRLGRVRAVLLDPDTEVG